MAVIGSLIKSTSKYAAKVVEKPVVKGHEYQEKQLKKLLVKAKKTNFGKDFNFNQILKSDDIIKAFQAEVPVFDYNLMFQQYWHKTLSGVENVSWPGKIKNFALTSGTTGSASKKIPVSDKMISSIKKAGIKQFLSFSKIDVPAEFYACDILFLGGSTALTTINSHVEGDLSGIMTGKVPQWLAPFSKPNRRVRALRNWEEKIEAIVAEAPSWNIGIVCGVPAWIQMMIERIVDHYGLNSIFDVWPNLKIYVHGGVNFEPYMLKFNEIFKQQVIYLDSYLTSEGFFAYQPLNSDGLELIVNNGVFFEFIPFNIENFDEEGELRSYKNAVSLKDAVAGIDYGIVVSTNAGTWRYLLGDTIKFTDKERNKIKITGRTKHFLSLCGEHLSVDNMTEALTKVCIEFNIDVREFVVIGGDVEGGFKHEWFFSSDKLVDLAAMKLRLDAALKTFNADYALERQYALKDIELNMIPTTYFYEFMKIKGKYGAQHKFPRVMKGQYAEDWKCFLLDKLEVKTFA
ncbi:GH3 auxin-responsive promoter [Putridiphycobacter roseus]|uniref:GH3 auxin-responsive promoter n=1 Tax=Putridiphycobacter roseus TaxID=2219161 RepID=A0A2W1NNS5_9FLAO|nr:GH3 auxin-responsive promoter family protein [Putridiphycobacter roseus]PZE16258.1 GH3 auxin-responsive promoter [Putridiphycobacter roseus]